jgi:hypothetical protein
LCARIGEELLGLRRRCLNACDVTIFGAANFAHHVALASSHHGQSGQRGQNQFH